VNANVKGHTDQLKAMFASNKFPEIETQVSLTDSDSSDYSKCKSKKKKPKKPKGQKSTKRQTIDRKRE
jgi:hypothetical protein